MPYKCFLLGTENMKTEAFVVVCATFGLLTHVVVPPIYSVLH